MISNTFSNQNPYLCFCIGTKLEKIFKRNQSYKDMKNLLIKSFLKRIVISLSLSLKIKKIDVSPNGKGGKMETYC